MLTIIMLWILTESIHKISSNYSFMILPWLCFVPGISIGTEASIKKINIGIIFFVAVCLCIGFTGTKLGFTQLLAKNIAEGIGQVAPSVFLYIIVALGTLVNLILTPGAIM